MDGRKACLLMVDALDLDRTIYRVGTSKIFFKAGVLAALEERRDALLYEIFSRLQAVARMYTARRQMKKILNRAVAIRTIQKNARIYGELRDWPWWQLYTKVIAPLLRRLYSHTDDKLGSPPSGCYSQRRRATKERAELALIRERAERTSRRKRRWRPLRCPGNEKRRVEDELEAERAVGLEKDAILDRSKHKEAELEEEITALQSYLETQDRHLDDIRKMQKEKDGTHELLKQAFEQAAEHLVRLENEQQEWVKREEQLVEELREHHEHLQALQADHEELTKVSEDLQSLVIQREEDLGRAKERTEVLVAELEGKLGVEHKNRSVKLTVISRHVNVKYREAMKSKVDALEQERKEERIVQLLDQLDTIKAERDSSSKQVIELQSDIDTLMAEIDAGKLDKERGAAARTKLEEELDDLRALMQAKTSEESKRLEVEKSREEELAELRRQASTLQQELSESRRLAAETQNKLKRTHCAAELTKAQASVAELEKSKRAAESELQAVRTRQANTDNELSTTLKSKTDLERQLVAIQSRRDELEDSFMEAEREKLTHLRHLEAAKKSLESENKKSAQLEKTIATMKSELATLKDQNVKLDRDLNKALKDVKDREWEIKKFESRQDKITVEHIHVYEKVKRATDRELQNLKQELQQNETYIRSLERMRDQLKTEAEDLERRTQQESLELRSKDKAVKSSEDKAARAQVDLETERKAKELAEMRAKKLESDLKAAQDQLVELSQEVLAAQRSKDNLEMELMRIADETETPNSVARAHREYQSRIARLEGQLEEAESGRETSDKIREVMERQHAEIRQLILSHNPNDQGFQSRLLEELQHTEDRLSKEMNGRAQNLKANRKLDFTTMANVTPTKASTPKRVRTESLPDPARVPIHKLAHSSNRSKHLKYR
ncbi:Myosin [Salix suchowensis]|nr:Myosin [Salix suchowensis]